MRRNEKLNGSQLIFPPSINAAVKKSCLALFIVAAVFSASFASMASSKDKAEKAAKTDTGGVTVENFGKVTEFYYRGAQPKGEEYKQLASLGIKTILDLRNDAKDYAKETAEQAGLKYINLPMSDKSYPAADAAEKFLSIVNDKENQPVYVHCAGGRHRTGAMTAVFRMDMQGWNAERAYDEMKDYDFYTRWGHKAMKRFVFDYYQLHLRSLTPKNQITVAEDQTTNK